LALAIKFTGSAAKYLQSLDRKTRERITEKLKTVADAPFDWRLSQPLQGSDKRKIRVGDYRVIFEVTPSELLVAHIGPRGQIYRKLKN
jgi:mRNA interferase RelE/StbE